MDARRRSAAEGEDGRGGRGSPPDRTVLSLTLGALVLGTLLSGLWKGLVFAAVAGSGAWAGALLHRRHYSGE